MKVFYPFVIFLQFVELVVMGGEEGLGPVSVLMDILHYGPGYRHTVKCAGAAAYLIQQYQRARCHVVEDGGGLQHLDHEGGLAPGDIVGSAHSGKYLVEQADMRGLGRYERTCLGHNRNQGCLSQQGGLTGHVRTGEDDDLLRLLVQIQVVGHVLLPGRHHPLYDRVTALLYLENITIVHQRAAVTVVLGGPGKRQQAVQTGYQGRILLHSRDIGLDVCYKLIVDTGLYGVYLLLGSADLFLVLLQLRSDVSFGRDKGLLADPLGRHLLLVGIAYLQIVTEYIVVTDSQRRYTGTLDLALLYPGDDILAVSGYAAQLVQFCVHPGGDNLALAYLGGRVGREFAGQRLPEFRTFVYLLGHPRQRAPLDLLQYKRLDRQQLADTPAQLHHLPGRYTARGHPGKYTFHIAHIRNPIGQRRGQFPVSEQSLHGILPGRYLLQVLGRHGQP